MRSHFLFLTLWFFLSCNKSPRASITRGEQIIQKDNECEVISYYPVIHLRTSIPDNDSVNKFLESINEMEKYKGHCSEYFDSSMRTKRKVIEGDYVITYQSDSIASIEFLVQGLPRKIYRAIFLDLIKVRLLEPNQVFPKLDRGKLYPYVKRFADSSGININLLAYQRDSRYIIMYGRTQDDLVLYLGGEGEFEGYYKLLIPLREIDPRYR